MNSYQWALHIKVSSLALFFLSTVIRLHFWGIFLNDWQHKCTSGLRNQRRNIFLRGGGGQAGGGLVVPDCQIKLLRFADSRAGKERKRTRERQNAKGGTDFPELRNCSGLHLEYSWAVDYRADWCTHTHTHTHTHTFCPHCWPYWYVNGLQPIWHPHQACVKQASVLLLNPALKHAL